MFPSLLSLFARVLILILADFVEYVDVDPVNQAALPLMEQGGEGKFSKWMGSFRQPLEQQIQNKKNGIGLQRRPYVGESNKAAHELEGSLGADWETRDSLCAHPGDVGRPYLRTGVQCEGARQSFLVQGASFLNLKVVYSVRASSADRPHCSRQ